jgi:uncharacterized repeat protein (TIGR04138 family)
MSQPHPIVKLLQEDDRYSVEAYSFVRDALSFGQHVLGYGEEHSPGDEDDDESSFLAELEESDEDEPEDDEEPHVERHLTGQQLCEAIRQYALEQYGYMSKVVLNSWGIHNTGDFGEIVYNLIRIGMMKKSDSDRREDFEDCYDFDEAFQQRYKITMAKE